MVIVVLLIKNTDNNHEEEDEEEEDSIPNHMKAPLTTHLHLTRRRAPANPSIQRWPLVIPRNVLGFWAPVWGAALIDGGPAS